jgi:hypothetical protein
LSMVELVIDVIELPSVELSLNGNATLSE